MNDLRNAVQEFIHTLRGERGLRPSTIISRLKTDEFVRRVYEVAEYRLPEGGSVMQDVWDLITQSTRHEDLPENFMTMCQRKIAAHLVYALNIFFLPPDNPKVDSITVTSKYYRTHIGIFIPSEAILVRLGYQLMRDGITFNRRFDMPRRDILDVFVRLLVLEQELEIVLRVALRAANQGILVRMDVILGVMCFPHASLEALWGAVRYHPSARPISPTAHVTSRHDDASGPASLPILTGTTAASGAATSHTAATSAAISTATSAATSHVAASGAGTSHTAATSAATLAATSSATLTATSAATSHAAANGAATSHTAATSAATSSATLAATSAATSHVAATSAATSHGAATPHRAATSHGAAASHRSAPTPPIPAAFTTTTSSHPSTHTSPITTARETATSPHVPNGWMCRNCATVNSYTESTCRECDLESFMIIVSPVRVGVDSSRRSELDGPVVRRMHPAREECPQCMFPISPGEDCPMCRNWSFGGAKAKTTLFSPGTSF